MIGQTTRLANLHRRTCVFSGQVQGVGFRYTVRNVAMQFDIAGYVRNLPDGRVELVMEGTDEDMNQMLQSVCQRMTGFFKKVDQSESAPTGEFDQFTIRH